MRIRTLGIIMLSVSALSEAKASERLLGFHADEQGLHFQVASGGCTKKSDFEVIQRETWPLQISLERLRPDTCDMLVPYGVTIDFSFDELHLKPGAEFVIFNNFGTIRIPG